MLWDEDNPDVNAVVNTLMSFTPGNTKIAGTKRFPKEATAPDVDGFVLKFKDGTEFMISVVQIQAIQEVKSYETT